MQENKPRQTYKFIHEVIFSASSIVLCVMRLVTLASRFSSQGRVIREKGTMKAATEAVFFTPDTYPVNLLHIN